MNSAATEVRREGAASVVGVVPPATVDLWPPRWLAALAVAFLGVYALGLLNPAFHPFLGGIAYQVPSVVAIALVPWALAGSRGRQRVGAALIGFSLLLWAAADAVYTFYTLVLGREAPVPSIADAMYYAGYAALIAAVALIAVSRRRLHDLRAWVDAATVSVVAGAFAWQFLVAPSLSTETSSLLELLVVVGYPLLDLALLVALIATLYGDVRNYSPGIWMLAAGIALLVATDALFSIAAPETVPTASFLDLGWLASYWLFAGFLAAWRVPAANPIPMPRGGQTLPGLVLPYAVVLPAFVYGMVSIGHGDPSIAVITGAFIAGGLLTVRQWLTLVENTRLFRSLESSAAALERARAEAVYLSQHDELTGLLNRRAWFAEARDGSTTAVVLFDIDHFKRINDTFGHPAGDAVLIETARRLRAAVGDGGVVGRVGGEEFAVALQVPGDALEAYLHRLFARLSPANVRIGDELVAVTMSGGAADCPRGCSERSNAVEAAYAAADKALYEAKRGGRNRMVMARLDLAEAA